MAFGAFELNYPAMHNGGNNNSSMNTENCVAQIHKQGGPAVFVQRSMWF
jgi:hypothetical protein